MVEMKSEIPKKTFIELVGGKVLTTAVLLVPFFIGLTVVSIQELIFREQLLRPIRTSNMIFNPFDEDAIKASIANQSGYDLIAVQTSFLSPLMQILGGILMVVGLYFIYRYITRKDAPGHYIKKTVVSFLGVVVTVYFVSWLAFFSGLSFNGITRDSFISMKPFGKLQVLPLNQLSECQLAIEKPFVGFDKLKYTFYFSNGEEKSMLVRIGASEAIKTINSKTRPEIGPEVKRVLGENLY